MQLCTIPDWVGVGVETPLPWVVVLAGRRVVVLVAKVVGEGVAEVVV